jgi:hypothetical protein
MDDLRSQMFRANETRKVETEEAKQRYNELSNKQLSDIFQKKIRTSFIGAISQFEETFGHLWGHNKDKTERTPQEKEFFDKWMLARTNILNNGNNQIRAMLNELPQYTITWNRYKTSMKPV